jgi:energy-coupling factor transporter ATP-binding protein EcfA2
VRKGSIIFEPHDVVLSTGKRGSGKSTRLKEALAAAIAAGQRVVVFDVLDEYSQLGRKRSSVVLGPLTRRMTVEDLADDVDVLLEDSLALAVVPVSKEPEDWAADFTALLQEVEEVGDLVLAADELAVWAQFCGKAIDRAACTSRHWGDAGVALAFGSQRATGIPFTTRTQATQILSGLQDMPADLEALRDRCGERFADEVAALKGHDFRHWRDTDGRWERTANTNKPGRARKEK